MTPSKEYLSQLMLLAIEEAKIASSKGEVPIGAVIADQSNIISKAHNEIESKKDATAHAEVLAIRDAAQKIGNWRLNDLILCVTLEPCTMCAGAIKQSRIPLVVFGAFDKRAGAFGSLYDLSNQAPETRVISGIEEQNCLVLLKDFFEQRRRDGRVVEGA